LYEELGFDPSRALVLRLAALRQQRVDFIYENHSRLVAPVHMALVKLGFQFEHLYLATAKSALTIFSPSPTHLEVSDEALMLKKVDLDCEAMHFPISVLPVPGGPKSRMPFGGPRSPAKMSGRNSGHTTIS
jgi:hypothetical protein